MIPFGKVNHVAYKKSTRSKYKTPQKRSTAANYDEVEEEEEYQEEHQCDNQFNDGDILADFEESTGINDTDFKTLPNVSRTTMRGMCIFDSIGDDLRNAFFFGGNKWPRKVHTQQSPKRSEAPSRRLASFRLRRGEARRGRIFGN